MKEWNRGTIDPTGDDLRLGMGCWTIGGHGWGKVDDVDSMAAINTAYENGIRLFDTADCYGLGHSEKILSRSLGSRRSRVCISTKAGVRWNPSGRIWYDNQPAYLRQALEASLNRLGLETVDFFFVHWPDGKTPVSDVLAELAKMKEAGLVQSVGLSNFSGNDLRKALESGVLDVVQVQASLLSRDTFLDLEKLCREHGVRVMVHGVLAQGLLTGKFEAGHVFAANDHRSGLPEFQEPLLSRSLGLVDQLTMVAHRLGVSVAHVALRAIMDQQGVDHVLFGARSPAQVRENLASLELDLSSQRASLDQMMADFGLPALRWRS